MRIYIGERYIAASNIIMVLFDCWPLWPCDVKNAGKYVSIKKL